MSDPKPVRFYIAARIEHADRAKLLRDFLLGFGWACTYDWMAHGSLKGEGVASKLLNDVAMSELRGVRDADVVIFLLPGGRGAHFEAGGAAMMILLFEQLPPSVRMAYLKMAKKRFVLWTDDPGKDLATDERTSAFYHLSFIEKYVEVPGSLRGQAPATSNYLAMEGLANHLRSTHK